MGLPGGAAAGGGDGSGGTLADAVSGLVVLGCAVRVVRGARKPLTRLAALVLGLPVAGVALAAAGSVGATGLTGMARYLQVFVLVPAAVVLLVRDERDLRLVAWSFVALALWQGGVGVRQYLTGTGASYQGADVRAVGTFGPNDIMGMATVVSFGLVCAVGLALGSGTRPGAGNSRAGQAKTASHGVRNQRTVAALCALLLVAPLALSFSRGAWIATVVALSTQLVMAGLRRAVRVFAAVAAAAVVLVAGMGVGSQMLSERLGSITQVTDAPDQSVTDRYTMWAAAVDMWRAEPLAGVGLKRFPEERDGHASLALSSGSDVAGAGTDFHRQPLLSPHNMYLLILSEQGLIGLTALAGSWAALLVCGLRRATARTLGATANGRPGSARSAHPAKDCASIACGLLVWQLTDFVYADIGGPSTVLTAVVLGMAAWWALADRTTSEAAR
ncbi:O-antigen ligase family protein [Streptomyces sp. NA04227]|uniref:O-antigen ligase family protein n=1 Tax=Streptomyces sp. NA04227 TaxID=2742136 RepID=UPI00159189AE|nr:O-antigen ligase family protein [Streptomyces sp. NA04227]QKW10891.1 O-antigen ligase family protein [Streptomyces sp. NA04227]